jgi:hypothetical protein
MPATPPIEPVDKEFVDKVVETAVDEALKHYRYPTAWALRTLYDEKSGDPGFVAMVEDVFSQSASTDALDEFSRQMEEKKREGKKDNQGCYYFVPPTTNSRFTPHKPKPAPYADLIHIDEEPARATKKIKTSHAAAAAGAGGGGGGGGVGDTPRKSTLASGGVKTPSSRKRGRRHSASSNSSLSSAMSISSPESTRSMASPLRQRGAAIPAVAAAAASAAAAAGVVGAQTQPQTRSAKSSDAPKPRPITTRGKSKQPVSNTSDSVSPTHSNHILNSNTTIATASTIASTTTPASATTIIKNSGASSVPHTTRLAEAGMPGRLSSSDFIANLSAKSSKASKEVLAKASMPRDEQDDAAFWDRRREAQKITNGYTALESSVRGRARGRDDEDDEEANATPARKSRRTRQSMVSSSMATRSTRSASRKPAADDGESIVSSSVMQSPAPIEASSTVGSRAVTPTSLRAPKKPKAGLRVKSS